MAAHLRRDATRSQVAGFALSAFVCLVILHGAWSTFTAPSFASERYVGEAVPPEVFARGTVQRRPGASELPALCHVFPERQEPDGASEKWVPSSGIANSRASLDVEWSSSPLPPSIGLTEAFVFEFGPPPQIAEGARLAEWKRLTQALGLEIADADGPTRMREHCFDAGDRVFVKACVSDAGMLGPCPGRESYVVQSNEALERTLAFSDGMRRASVAAHIGWASFALLVGLLAFVRRPPPLVEALEARTTSPRSRVTAGVVHVVILVAFVIGAFTFLDHSYLWGGGVALLWLLVAFERRSNRARLLAVRKAVLDTPRSLLAEAHGTVELAVRARLGGEGVRSFLGDEVVALSELRIREVFYEHRLDSREVLVRREGDALEILDESGEGVLALEGAVLELEPRRVRVRRLPPRLVARGIELPRPSLYYIVEERVVRDGEPLFVVGDVSRVAHQAAESDYRTMKRQPTIGTNSEDTSDGEGRPSVVYSGDEGGLITTLAARARTAQRLSIVALFAAIVLAAALVALH